MVESLFDPYYRARFLSLLEKGFQHQGGFTFPPLKETAAAGQEDVVEHLLKHVAEAVRKNLSAEEALVALFRDPTGASYVMGTAALRRGGQSVLAADLKTVMARAVANPSSLVKEIYAKSGQTWAVGVAPATALAAPIRLDENVCGVVMAATHGDGERPPDIRSNLPLVAVLLSNAVSQVANEITNEERLRSLAHSLSAALDARDANSRGHSDRVAMYAMAIVNEMRYDENDPLYQELRSRIRLAALLHDIGKIGIPDNILLKPDKLTEEEYEFIKQHSIMGAEIVTACEGLKDLVPGVLYHHENFDGTGYPFGTAGQKIPLLARVIALADAFDAITSDRPFHKAASKEEALEILRRQASHRYDPTLLESLLRAYEKGMLEHVRLPSRSSHFAESGDTAIETRYGSYLRSIPSLPSALTTLNTLLDDPDTALSDVAKVLSSDQGIASRVLRLVNSAYYGLPQMVATIPLAATLLGARAIKHHVVNIALADLMNALGGGNKEYEILWRHALKTSAWAKAIAKLRRRGDPEEAFTAGLVHDIGKALALRIKPRDYGKVIHEALKTGKPLMGVEEQVIGFDHTRIGGWAAVKWMLPEILANCIRWHHEPDAVDRECAEICELVRVVHIADIVARNCDDEERTIATCLTEEASPQVLKEVGGELVASLEQARASVEEQEQALQETFMTTPMATPVAV
ncbi:MAG TPA: HDOD domain-containing protein [bacterium]|nr:HDOD domain-containing protein [bacterium]